MVFWVWGTHGRDRIPTGNLNRDKGIQHMLIQHAIQTEFPDLDTVPLDFATALARGMDERLAQTRVGIQNATPTHIGQADDQGSHYQIFRTRRYRWTFF